MIKYIIVFIFCFLFCCVVKAQDYWWGDKYISCEINKRLNKCVCIFVHKERAGIIFANTGMCEYFKKQQEN